MTTRLFFRILVPVLFLGVCATVVAIWANRSLNCFPSPDKESTFLRSYAPKQVIDGFASKEFGGQREEGMSSAAGRNFVTNDRTIVPMFAIESDQTVAMMLALKDDMSKQLRVSKAEILSESGDPQSGFRFSYRLGRNVGTATIPPVVTRNSANRGASLPDGMQDVAINIKISEKWFPTDETATQASLKYP